MSKDGGNTDEKINNVIQDVLSEYKKMEKKDQNNVQQINVDTSTIYIIPVKLLGHNGDGLYFVHPSSEIYPDKLKEQKLQYSTAYVIPQDPTDPADYTNINYIDVPPDYRGKGIASKLLSAVEKWCTDQRGFTLIRLENDTDINENTGLPSTLYEKAGYHYLNKDIEYTFKNKSGTKTITRSGGNEMEKVLMNGKHSEDCQFHNNKQEVLHETRYEYDSKAELLVCKKSEKRDHWRHIEPKNMIRKIDELVLRSRTVDKGTSKPQTPARFSRRIKGKTSRAKQTGKTYRSGSRSKVKSKRSRSGSRSKVTGKTKVKAKRSRSKVKANTKNKSRRIKV